MTEVGSHEVRFLLAATAQWLRSLDQLDPKTAWEEGRPFPLQTFPQDLGIERLAVKSKTNDRAGDGEMTAIRHAVVLSKTPAVGQEAPMILNAHEPWLRRF